MANGFAVEKLPDHILIQLRATLAAAPEFFRATADKKLASRLADEAGYRPMGVEYSVSPDRPDHVESFSVNGRTLETPPFEFDSARVLWQEMRLSFGLLEHIVEGLAAELAANLAGEAYESKLRGGFRRWSRLQLNYARPSDARTPFIN